MSNPVTAVFPLVSNLTGTGQSGALALTGVDPIIYESGLLLQESKRNYVRTPTYTASGRSGTQVDCTVTRLTSQDGFNDVFRIQGNGTGANWYAAFYAPINSGVVEQITMVESAYLWVPSGTKDVALNCIIWRNDYGAYAQNPTTVSVTTTPTRYSASTVMGSAFELGDSNARIGMSASSTEIIYAALVQSERSYLSSPIDTSLGAGYTDDGTPVANYGTTRAASSASISPSGIIDTYLGAIVFRATPTVETGAEEIWGELGEKGAGTDHIRWGRDATKHPYVEWSGNDSAYTRITLTPTVDAGDEHFYSIEWHVGDADFRLYLDDNPSDNDTIPSPQEDYGAGTLKLEATAGGVIYNGLMICNERLTNAQRARLQDVGHWSVRTLERLRVEVARPQFELRPY